MDQVKRDVYFLLRNLCEEHGRFEVESICQDFFWESSWEKLFGEEKEEEQGDV